MEYKWTALSVTLVGTILSGVNIRIIVVGLPTIGRQLHTGPEELVWLTQAFLLAGIVFTVLVGRIGDMVGRARIYTAGFAVFTLGAALCSLSSNAYEIISFRVLQGVGSAMILANSSAIVTDASPPKELGTMLSLNSAGFASGSMFGLTVSGLVLSVTDWRGLFWVSIPIGVFGTIWAHYRLREISTKSVGEKMDWMGIGLFTGGLFLSTLSITSFTYGVSNNGESFGLLFAGIAMLILFVRVETKSNSPFLDLDIFRIRLFAAGNLAQLFNAITWTGVGLLAAFYLQLGLGYTPLQAGLGILPVEMSYVTVTLISGRLSDKYGNVILSTSGLSIAFVGFLAMSTLGVNAGYPQIAIVLSLIGAGNGLFNSPNNRSIMSSVPPNRRGVAGAFRNLMFSTGALLSYGLVVLFITFGIPYGLFSQLIQETIHGAGLVLARAEFINGFRFALYCLAALDIVSITMSVFRGQGDARTKSERKRTPEAASSDG